MARFPVDGSGGARFVTERGLVESLQVAFFRHATPLSAGYSASDDAKVPCFFRIQSAHRRPATTLRLGEALRHVSLLGLITRPSGIANPNIHLRCLSQSKPLCQDQHYDSDPLDMGTCGQTGSQRPLSQFLRA